MEEEQRDPRAVVYHFAPAIRTRQKAPRTRIVDVHMCPDEYKTGPDNGEDDGSGGATHPRGNPLDGAVFQTADGFLMVTALFRPFDALMADLEDALGVSGLAADARFADLETAKNHRDDLRAILNPVFEAKRSEEWIPLLEEKDILVAPVR